MAEVPSASIAAAIEALKNPCDLDTILACAASHLDEQVAGGPRIGMLHPRFREDVPLVEDLARVLTDQCVYYALPRRKRLDLHEQIKNDMSKIARTMAIVRDVFVAFNARHPSRASEVGEVLAYCIAQTHLSAAQMASKMALKTSANMPVHGLDGVHAVFKDGVLTVYFLEAKLASGARVGTTRYAKSAAEFLANKKQYHREYQLIGDLGHFDSLEGEARQAAIDYFDIWNKPTGLSLRERFVGVICHSEPKHFADKLPVEDGPVDVHELHFGKLYAADRAGHRVFANKAIIKAGGNPAKSILYFVAVPDINELRRAFYNAIGLPIPEGACDADDDDDIDDADDADKDGVE
ncbi:HamA C-terminal domain-containing protein [Brevundimonas sp.]